MRFDGNIIITDPCYIIKEDTREKTPCPNRNDYFSHKNIFEYPDAKKIEGFEEYNEDFLYISELYKKRRKGLL